MTCLPACRAAYPYLVTINMISASWALYCLVLMFKVSQNLSLVIAAAVWLPAAKASGGVLVSWLLLLLEAAHLPYR